MAVQRQFNWLASGRADVPHLRLVELGVANDFDVALGGVTAGGVPRIVKGFTIGATTGPASSLILTVAGGLVLHPTASESGTIYSVPSDEPAETLAPTNPHVVGSFAPSAVNFVGLDLVRQTNDATADLVMFLSTATLTDSPRQVPLGRTLVRRIVISTVDPSATPGLCPIARVTTDVSNNVVSVVDARPLLGRLGTGGGQPDPLHTYAWPFGRGDSTDFTPAGDKGLGDLKTWMDAVMTRSWEIGGGERWYSGTADRNVTLTGLGATFGGTGEYFEWTGTNVHWQNLAVLFDNSTGHINVIADQTTDSAGLTDLADGECVYVDLDRTQDRTGGSALVARKATLLALGQPTVPGSRWVLAWRRGSQVYFRGKVGPIGATSVPNATTLVAGSVFLSGTPGVIVALSPRVATLNASAQAMAAGMTRAGSVMGNGALAIGPDATADTGITYGNASMAGGHVVDGAAGGAEVTLVRNNTDRAGSPNTHVATWQQNDSGAGGMKNVFRINGSGAVSLYTRLAVPATPAAGEVKVYVRNGGTGTLGIQVCIMCSDGVESVILER